MDVRRRYIMKQKLKILFLIFIIFILSAIFLFGISFVINFKKSGSITSPNAAQQSNNISNGITVNNALPIQQRTNNASTASTTTTTDCAITSVNDIVNGGSMSGILENGQHITILEGYYKCHEVQRNDLIIYKYAGNIDPLVKIVRAVPGDRWSLKMASEGYEIIVNDSPLKNSAGVVYQIPAGNIKILNLYVTSYPVIPQDTYLILGNLPEGTLDGTRFGLISKNDIVGKVIK